MIEVEAHLYATFGARARTAVPGEPVHVALPDGATVADLLARFGLAAGEARILLVNGRSQPPSHPLAGGDRVALFPPVGGG
jgi:molybdopterin converting factor small subunit